MFHPIIPRKWKVLFSELRPLLPCPNFPPTSLAAIRSALGRCHLALQAVSPELARSELVLEMVDLLFKCFYLDLLSAGKLPWY